MVSGHTQAINSAPVKANASMDTLELKVPKEDLSHHLQRIRHISAIDKERSPIRQSKANKSTKSQQEISASKSELQSIKSRNKNGVKIKMGVQAQAIKAQNIPLIKRIIVQRIQMPGLV